MSPNCIDWLLLPEATNELMSEVRNITGRFTGDPAYQYVVREPSTKKAAPEDWDAPRHANPNDHDHEADHDHDSATSPTSASTSLDAGLVITEESRLAATIALIDEDAAVVPRGAFMRTPKVR